MNKTKQLKIKLALVFLLFIACVISLLPFISITSTSAMQTQAMYQFFSNRHRCMETFKVQMLEQAEALIVEYKVPLTDCLDGRLYDVREGSVYTGDGNRLFLLQEANLVIAQNGDIITIDDTNVSSQNGSLAIYYNEHTQEFLDGANRNLAIFLNSRLDRNELRSGGRYTRTIRLDTTIYLVSYRMPNGRYNEIFVSIQPYRTGWWIFGNNRFRIYDMNGRVLDYNRIGFPQPAEWWKPKWTHFRQFNRIRNMFETMETFVLGDLLHQISFATIHPWPQIIEPTTGFTVITEDGRDIRVNPRTRQLTDFFGFALFNERNGLPILFHGNDIITTNREQQRIGNAVLLEAMTVQDLLHRGIDFHMHIVPTPFGNFDVPVVNLGSFYNEDWRLMNGDSTDGITIEHRDSQNLNTWQSFWEGLSNFGGRLGGIFRPLLIIGGVILGLVVMFAVVWFFKYFFPAKQKSGNGTTIIMGDDNKHSKKNNSERS